MGYEERITISGKASSLGILYEAGTGGIEVSGPTFDVHRQTP